MKIGIIVYSQTGHTKSVAEKVQGKLAEAGHDVHLEEVVPAGEVHPGMKTVEFTSAPDVEAYEGVVFASPVQAFSLAAAMKAYLPGIGSLQNKKAACFVTKQLPGKWTGGNRAVRQMKTVCSAKGAEVAESSIVIWSNKDRDAMINETVEKVSRVFL